MAFQINSTSPPAGCAPGGRGQKLQRPEATGLDGRGAPVGACGLPRAIIHFDRLSMAGWNWYSAFVNENLSATITSLQIWDANKTGGPGYVTFAGGGIMHRPTHSTFEYGAYTNVEIIFTELELT